VWLVKHQRFVFPLDHPGLATCAGIKTWEHDPATCTDRGKHPAVKWSRDATTDPQMIAAWFTGSPRNIGIACKPSGLLVVDEDTPGGFARYANEHGREVPATFTVITRRAFHYYFDDPTGELGNAAGPLKSYGCDVRGGGRDAGGYVVGPGSVHATGVLYAPVDSAAPVLPVPGWLRAALTVPHPRQQAQGDSQGVPAKHTGPIPYGSRHAALVSYAGYLRRLNLPFELAQVLMLHRLRDCTQPPQAPSPVTPGEAVGKLRDVFERYSPRGVPGDLVDHGRWAG